jgi:hypothetical protein
VYWFHCAPACKFLLPIILEIQHCAKENNLQALSVVKARPVEDNSGAEFNKVLGCYGIDRGVFPNHSSYGFTQLDSFSGYGVDLRTDSIELTCTTFLRVLISGRFTSLCYGTLIHITQLVGLNQHTVMMQQYYYYTKYLCAGYSDSQ